ncbi:hypothetical protein DsansV1_C44g0240991 [Dioscorea sansibarensis]
MHWKIFKTHGKVEIAEIVVRDRAHANQFVIALHMIKLRHRRRTAMISRQKLEKGWRDRAQGNQFVIAFQVV